MGECRKGEGSGEGKGQGWRSERREGREISADREIREEQGEQKAAACAAEFGSIGCSLRLLFEHVSCGAANGAHIVQHCARGVCEGTPFLLCLFIPCTVDQTPDPSSSSPPPLFLLSLSPPPLFLLLSSRPLSKTVRFNVVKVEAVSSSKPINVKKQFRVF
jgi:hypothetical protein